MKIETKFNVGDVVYVCKNNGTHGKEPCKICEGTGVISIQMKHFAALNVMAINLLIPKG